MWQRLLAENAEKASQTERDDIGVHTSTTIAVGSVELESMVRPPTNDALMQYRIL
jgi:hypothetical protein